MTAIERRLIGATGVAVTRLGVGTGPLGGWPAPMDPAVGRSTLERAWELGVRHFDTAPLYGYGQSERWLGEMLRSKPRSEFTISTKVGRLLRHPTGGPSPDYFHGTTSGLRPVWDFSADGVRRSLLESLERLGLDRVDIALIHDPDEHVEQAIAEAYPALAELRAEGTVGAIGAGMNHVQPLVELIDQTDIDCVLVAGRWTLLDQSAGTRLLPLAAARGVSVIAAGVFHQGLLLGTGATPPQFAGSAEQRARVASIGEACGRCGVSVASAAIQFPLRHHAVTSVLLGVRSPLEVERDIDALPAPIPESVWDELTAIGPLAAPNDEVSTSGPVHREENR